MNNLDRYRLAFLELFSLQDSTDFNNLSYQSVDSWDSVGHMELITRLESDFDVMIEMDDVIDFSSYEKGIQILQKYQISFE
jgi:acyl carrier protein